MLKTSNQFLIRFNLKNFAFFEKDQCRMIDEDGPVLWLAKKRLRVYSIAMK
jgi:hypothetical protein